MRSIISLPAIALFFTCGLFCTLLCSSDALGGGLAGSSDEQQWPPGWAVGVGGTILKSSDGGQSWQQQELNIDADLYAIDVVDKRTAWIVGDKGTIIRMTDAGESWQRVPADTTSTLVSVFFLDNQTGWIANKAGAVLRTVDGGENWSSYQIAKRADISSIFFTDSEHGWAAGFGGTLFRTSDAGSTWTKVFPRNDGYTSICFVDEKRGWLSAGPMEGSHNLVGTTDGGETWTGQVIGEGTASSVYFFNERLGWLSTVTGQIWRTQNGGRNWTRIPARITDLLKDVYFIDETLGVAVGDIILRTKDHGREWEVVMAEPPHRLHSVRFAE